jgi:predicted neuraminidase
MPNAISIARPNAERPSAHAATLVEPPGGGLLAAWFGGTREGHPDVAIWLARWDGAHWSPPVKVADEPGVPLWNPVLFRDRSDILWLFYKVAPTIPAWTGLYRTSRDGGRSWSSPTALPAGLLGPSKNKPITLSNGDILCGTSSESWRSWSCWVEISADGGHSWSRHGPIVAPQQMRSGDTPAGQLTHDRALPQDFAGVIQPSVWEHKPGRLTMLMRATARIGAVCVSHSDDYGRTWSPAQPTALANPNSGLDAARLADGRVALACNPTRAGRSPLALLLSADNGATWPWRHDLETEPGEYSYPAIIQAADGRVHLAYTYRREEIRHVVLQLEDLKGN